VDLILMSSSVCASWQADILFAVVLDLLFDRTSKSLREMIGRTWMSARGEVEHVLLNITDSKRVPEISNVSVFFGKLIRLDVFGNITRNKCRSHLAQNS
jgi:hypothetical protein